MQTTVPYAVLMGGAVALEMPQLPPLSTDPDVIAVADGIRVGMLILGLTVAAVATRHMMVLPKATSSEVLIRGFRWRSAALVIGTTYVCLSQYDKVGHPVSVQFLIGLLFLLTTLRSVHHASKLPAPPLQSEQYLTAHLDAYHATRDRDGA